MIERYLDLEPAIDDGAWVHDSAYVGGDVTLARGASVWPLAVLRGDQGAITVGEDSNVQDGVIVHATGGISTTVIGRRVTVGHGAVLHGCIIEDECLIGMNAVVLDNAVIGTGSVVGAGAVVTANTVVPPGSLVLGSPARVVRAVKESHVAAIENGWRSYNRLRDEHAGRG